MARPIDVWGAENKDSAEFKFLNTLAPEAWADAAELGLRSLETPSVRMPGVSGGRSTTLAVANCVCAMRGADSCGVECDEPPSPGTLQAFDVEAAVAALADKHSLKSKPLRAAVRSLLLLLRACTKCVATAAVVREDAAALGTCCVARGAIACAVLVTSFH
jgi:hypothetical protein